MSPEGRDTGDHSLQPTRRRPAFRARTCLHWPPRWAATGQLHRHESC